MSKFSWQWKLRSWLLTLLRGVSVETHNFVVQLHDARVARLCEDSDKLYEVATVYAEWKTCPPERSAEVSAKLHSVLSSLKA